jgi:hypothetical protein
MKIFTFRCRILCTQNSTEDFGRTAIHGHHAHPPSRLIYMYIYIYICVYIYPHQPVTMYIYTYRYMYIYMYPHQLIYI